MLRAKVGTPKLRLAVNRHKILFDYKTTAHIVVQVEVKVIGSLKCSRF